MKKFILLTLLIFINSSYEDIRKKQDKKYKKQPQRIYKRQYSDLLNEYSEISKSIEAISNINNFIQTYYLLFKMKKMKEKILILQIRIKNSEIKKDLLVFKETVNKSIDELKEIINKETHKDPSFEEARENNKETHKDPSFEEARENNKETHKDPSFEEARENNKETHKDPSFEEAKEKNDYKPNNNKDQTYYIMLYKEIQELHPKIIQSINLNDLKKREYLKKVNKEECEKIIEKIKPLELLIQKLAKSLVFIKNK